MVRVIYPIIGITVSIIISIIFVAQIIGTQRNSHIFAFHGTQYGNTDIFLHDVSSNITTRLTHHAAVDAHPEWSPDGTKIAFASNRAGGGELFIMTVATNEIIQITNNPNLSYADPTWSPDGTQLAFVADGGRFQQDIYTINLLDGNEKNLTRATLLPSVAPRWSPDGDVIWLSVRDAGNLADRIYTVNPDTLELIIHVDESDFSPGGANNHALSQDGLKLAFTVGGNELWVRENNTFRQIALPTLGTSRALIRQPEWLPDGQRLSMLVSVRNRWSWLLIDLNNETINHSTIVLRSYSDINWKSDTNN